MFAFCIFNIFKTNINNAQMRAVARIFALFELLNMLNILQHAKKTKLKKNANEQGVRIPKIHPYK
jgi:hypothetical protein